jgi:hypothetical protein
LNRTERVDMKRIVVLIALVAFFSAFSPLLPRAFAYVSLGTGDSSLLGGDLTDPEDSLEPVEDCGAGTEEQLKPKNATWVKMTCAPANGPGEIGNQQHPYQSWVGTPASAIFWGKPETKNWYVSFKDGGYGGPTRDYPYFCAVELSQPHILTHFTICNSAAMPERDPKSWAIQGSNTGKKDDWTDLFVCDYEKGDTSPFKKYPRNETVLYTSFTSDSMAKAVTPADLEKLTAKLGEQKIAKADFATPARAYTWFRIAIYACVNPNTKSIADPNAPPGFALGQLELFGAPAKDAAPEKAAGTKVDGF